MQRYIDLLNSFKRGDVAPVFLFYGDESYLREQALQTLKESLLSPENLNFNLDQVDGEEVRIQEIVALAETPPVMSKWRLVIVRHAPFFASSSKKGSTGESQVPAVPGESDLINYLRDPFSTTCLVFNTGHPVDQRSRLFKAVQKYGRVVEFAYLKPGDLTRWLVEKARLAGKKMEYKAAEMLVKRSGRSMSLLLNELQKVISYAGEKGTITQEDVYQVGVPVAEENIFDVVDAIGESRGGKAVSGIRNLLAARQPPPLILTMVARQFRLILQAGELRARGYELEELASRLSVHPYVARKALAQSRNFSRERAMYALEKLLELDVAVKNGTQDFSSGMELLVLELCSSGEPDFTDFPF